MKRNRSFFFSKKPLSNGNLLRLLRSFFLLVAQREHVIHKYWSPIASSGINFSQCLLGNCSCQATRHFVQTRVHTIQWSEHAWFPCSRLLIRLSLSPGLDPVYFLHIELKLQNYIEFVGMWTSLPPKRVALHAFLSSLNRFFLHQSKAAMDWDLISITTHVLKSSVS